MYLRKSGQKRRHRDSEKKKMGWTGRASFGENGEPGRKLVIAYISISGEAAGTQ